MKPKKGGRRRNQAKQWTYYIETLKRTTDCIYEICRSEQSVAGCKEALMYLTNSVRDFEGLIDSINVELQWDVAAERPQAVAWEIRKTMTSPSKAGSNIRDTDALLNMLKFSPVILPETMRDTPLPTPCSDMIIAEDKPQQSEEKLGDVPETPQIDDGDWQVVIGRNKRRRSAGSSTTTCDAASDEQKMSSPNGPITAAQLPPSNVQLKRSVYERLSAGLSSPRVTPIAMTSSSTSNSLMCPRSAMDLPQTKASMAKMAYSRQLLWHRHQQSVLAEKLRERRRRRDVEKRRCGSLPHLATVGNNCAPTNSAVHIGLNFADPHAVSKSAQAFQQQQEQKRRQNQGSATTIGSRNGTRKSLVPSNVPAVSLESIKESAVETEEERDLPPADPKPRSESEEFERSELLDHRSLSYPQLPPGLDCDETWRAMTEEEESLAQEEQSLKKEIEEEENLSIDAELERQVAAEAGDDEYLDDDKLPEEEEAAATPEVDPLLTSSPPAAKQLTWQDVVNNWKLEMESYAGASWSEIVEREITHFRRPGEMVEMHEKMSSPSRRRNTEESTRKREERLVKAEELRQQLQHDKAQRLKELSNKVQEVRQKREELIEKKRIHLEMRMEKAKENRQRTLDDIVKKAKDDDKKVAEIAFINTMEADKMQWDIHNRQQAEEQRLQILMVERARRNEEKAAKEAAVEERRKQADQQRNERLRDLADKKRVRQEQAEATRNEQERERIENQKEKQRQHQERVDDMKAVEAMESEKLLKKIQRKQEESQRRHEERVCAVRAKAIELCSPRPADSWLALVDCVQMPSDAIYDDEKAMRICIMCEEKIVSDFHLVAHLCSREHLKRKQRPESEITYELLKMDMQEAVVEREIKHGQVETGSMVKDSTLEQEKIRLGQLKKRRNKLRQKFLAKAKDFEESISKGKLLAIFSTSPGKTCIDKPVRDVRRIVKTGEVVRYTDDEIHTLERALGEWQRALTAAGNQETRLEYLYRASWFSGGFDSLISLIAGSVVDSNNDSIPTRTFVKVVVILTEMVGNSGFLAAQLLFSNRCLSLLDAICSKFRTLNDCNNERQAARCEKLHLECCLLWEMMSRLLRLLAIIEEHSTVPQRISWQDLGIPLGGQALASKLGTVTSYLALNGVLRYITDYVDGEQCKTFVTLEQSTTKVMGIEQLMELLHLLLTHSDQSDLESFCATIVPLLCRQLYTQLRCENCSDLSDIGRVFTSELMRLWIMLGMLNGDRILKKLCSAENPSSTELCVRMAYIFMTLLNHLGKTVGVGEALGEQDRAIRQRLLHGTITAVGHFANIDEWCQVLTTLGWQRSIVLQLCSLPLAYFADRKLMEILLPSLISCCYRNAKAMDLLKQELSPTILITFIEENERSPADCPQAMEFSKRFPKKQWPEAREFFARS